MKKKLTSKLMLKIVSVIVAFLFWLVIINITDPTTSKTFYDIPVQILNENVITSANQVFDIVDGDTVKVTVKGKRSFVEKLKESDFTATADLSELSKVNAVSINVKLNKESTSSVDVDWNNAVLKVALEKRITKSFKVEVDYEGELSENYVLGEMTAKPNMIEVSCGESKFKKIDHVGVMVSLKGQSEDFDSEYSPVLYDANGDALNDANVSFSNDTIKVSTQVLSTKEYRFMWRQKVHRHPAIVWFRLIINPRVSRFQEQKKHWRKKSQLRCQYRLPEQKRTSKRKLI